MKKVTILFEPIGIKMETNYGATIFQAINEAGISIRSDCGGKGICGKCRVIIKNNYFVNDVTYDEKKHLTESEINYGYRLACKVKILKNIVVTIPPESRINIRKIQIHGLEKRVKLNTYIKKIHIMIPKPTLTDIRSDFQRLLDSLPKKNINFNKLEIDYEILKELPIILRKNNWDVTVTIWDDRKIIAIEPSDTSGDSLGFAVDIGTSKIVGYLIDLTSGKTIGIGSLENPQMTHGEDIITRINFAFNNNDNLELLKKIVIDGINDLINYTCEIAKVNQKNIYEIIIVGNTAMHHFFLGIQTRYVALSPYPPVIIRQINFPSRDFNLKINQGGIVTMLPLIAGFVGSDAVADVLVTEIYASNKIFLLLDIGTNTEVFLGNSEDILCCSAASGPAFEGTHIKHGMKAASGAIERIYINSELNVDYETIENKKPIGICGSAIIDVIAEMLKNGIINIHGRFNTEIKSKRIQDNGIMKEYIIAWGSETLTGKDITITQKDIDEIQLAKSAIYTACSLLMKRKNIEEKDIDGLLIAGAFGYHIDPGNANIIGLIPEIPIEKIQFIGNTAVTGAKTALISKENRIISETISKNVRYLELAKDPDFEREFLKNLLFSKIK